ncbi:MAG: SDR family oxidoreductase [Bacteroidota bacterium]
MSQILGKKALITGGASGIGKLMGRLLLQKGLDTLVIWDLNEALMLSTEEELKAEGFKVRSYKVNVMDTQSVISTARLVNEEIGMIDILINNAGIIVGKYFLDHTHEDIDRTMGINSSALMHITSEFLPAMVASKTGHIVNIASAAGLVSNPKMSVYVASKFSVVGWSDSLLLEMKIAQTNVQVTTVTPFYISTGMFDGVKSSIVPIVKPEVAVRKIIKGLENNRRYVRMPGIVNWVPLFKGILPAFLFDIIVGQWLGMYRSMDDFKGR